jgi:hypothetical protein
MRIIWNTRAGCRRMRMMTRLWQVASVVAALGVIAVGTAKLTSTSTPSRASEAVTPLSVPTPAGCMDSRIQVPTTGGPQWNKIIVCMDSQ